MKIPNYIILTPIATFKAYSLNCFIKNVISFQPKPKELVFCAEPELVPKISKLETKLKEQGIKLVILKLEQNILNKFPGYNLKKLTHSREHLRSYFTHSKFKWALWLDSDIIPDSDVAQALLSIAKSEKCLAVVNECPARITKGLVIAGTGCALTHKTACIFAKFQISPVIWRGKEIGCLADDFWFFVMLRIANPQIKKWTGWNSKKRTGRFVSIRHIPGHGYQDKFLNKNS